MEELVPVHHAILVLIPLGEHLDHFRRRVLELLHHGVPQPLTAFYLQRPVPGMLLLGAHRNGPLSRSYHLAIGRFDSNVVLIQRDDVDGGNGDGTTRCHDGIVESLEHQLVHLCQSVVVPDAQAFCEIHRARKAAELSERADAVQPATNG